MKIKNFIHYPKGGKSRKEIERTIRDIEKQISYLNSIGYADPDSAEIGYWRGQLEWSKKRLARFAKECGDTGLVDTRFQTGGKHGY